MTLDCQLSSAFQSMGGNSAAVAVAFSVGYTNAETPGGPIASQRTAEIGVFPDSFGSSHGLLLRRHLGHFLEDPPTCGKPSV